MNGEKPDKDAEIACIVGTLPPVRGISAYFERLTEALSPVMSIEVAVFEPLYFDNLYPGYSAHVGWADDSDNKSEPRKINALNPLDWIRAVQGLRARLLHLQWWSPMLAPTVITLLLLARLRGKVSVLTLHNIRSHEVPIVDGVLLPFALRLAHAVVVHDDSGLQTIKSRFKGILRCIRPGTLGRTVIGREDARQRLGIDGDIPTVLFFGNIRRYKGLDVLLRAFEELEGIGPILLLIAGDCWEDWQARYEVLVRRLGSKVKVFLGFQPLEKMDLLFSSADVVALPYYQFSGQSGVGTLALRYGCPLVVTDVGGLPELVDNPVCVCTPGDPHSLAEALSSILTDQTLLRDLRRSAVRIGKGFDWGKAAKAHAQLYREVISS